MHIIYILSPCLAIGGVVALKNFYDYSKDLSLLKGSDENITKILYNGFRLGTSSIYSYCMRKIFSGVIDKKSKNTYGMPYFHNMSWYKFPIIIKRGPKSCITSIIDGKGNDVTSEVLPYMGPNMDFYSLSLSVKDLGYDKLTFIIDDEEMTFDDNIKL